MAKTNKKDFDRNVEDQLRAYNTLVDLQKKELNGLTQILSLKTQESKAALDLMKAENERNLRFKEYKDLVEQVRLGQDAAAKSTITSIEKQLKKDQQHINVLKTKVKLFTSLKNMGFGNLKDFANEMLKLSAFDDKPIRETIMDMGLGAERGKQIRDAFYEAAPAAALLGASMKDLYEIQRSYTDESGRAVALTGEQLINVNEIAKGTTLGASQAAQMAAQFELLGMNTEKTHEMVQGIVDSSERMGINSNKVLKTINNNFKELNKFAFKEGIKGMAKMAQYAEKFKVNIDESINSATMARSLDGAVEMAATLNTLGGEFAKSDPFELFHLSRNDPAKYTQKLNEMTKGMASLVKTADGFEIKVSPVDMDRLRVAAEATGQDFGTMVQQAQRMAEIQNMNRQMMGTAFSAKDRELIQGLAKLDSKSGIYKVLGKDISKLSAQEVESLKIQQTTLKERAEASQTFDEKFQNTIQSMKMTLLPILDGINAVFDTIHPYLKSISEWMQSLPDWSKTGMKWAGVGVGLLAAGKMLKGVVGGLPFVGKLLSSGAGKAAASATGAGGGGGGLLGGGKGALGGGAGIGLASAGIGAGIAVAAVGISKLADSMAKLTPEQAETLETIAMTLAISFPLAAIGIGILAAVAAPAAIPLLALGGAMLMIGAAVGIAAAGIGYMAEGFGGLLQQASPEKVFALAAGVTALAGSMYLLAGGSVLSLFTGGGAIAQLMLMASMAPSIEKIGNAMKNIAVVLDSDGEGLTRLKETLDSIQNINSSGGVLSELKSLFKDGLKVKFDEKNVQMNVNVSLEVDSEVIARKTAKKIVVLHKDYQDGKAG